MGPLNGEGHMFDIAHRRRFEPEVEPPGPIAWTPDFAGRADSPLSRIQQRNQGDANAVA
jgi:hypothetical protein